MCRVLGVWSSGQAWLPRASSGVPRFAELPEDGVGVARKRVARLSAPESGCAAHHGGNCREGHVGFGLTRRRADTGNTLGAFP